MPPFPQTDLPRQYILKDSKHKNLEDNLVDLLHIKITILKLKLNLVN